MTRHESAEEQADRKFSDLLQELRVMQTGVQLTAGFLLTLPFQQAFGDLTDGQRRMYLALVVLAGLTTALVLAPVAVHRRLSGQHVKGRVVQVAHRLAQAALGFVALLVVGITGFIFDVVGDRATALVAAGVMAVVAGLLMYLLPRRLVDHA
jgi:MFS family permease